MARHWSAYVPTVTERQAYALDKMAEAAEKGDGMDLLMWATGCSRSKVGKLDRITIRHALDKCFKGYGEGS